MRSLVIGGNGQDGTYAVRSLLARGHRVLSIGRERVPRFAHETSLFEYQQLDLREAAALAALLASERPELVFHFAAVHTSSSGEPYERQFGDMLAVNVASVHLVLEYLRSVLASGRLLFASSIKAFGEPPPARIDERTPRKNTCLYSITKNAATDLIRYYRSRHRVCACVVFLCNHESPLRPPEFFVPKLARCLVEASPEASRSGNASKVTFRTLDFWCDWGSAEEYADIAVDILEKAPGEDFVLGTGRCLHARELAPRLFEERGLRLADHVLETGDASTDRPGQYHVDASKLERFIGRVPLRSIESVVSELTASIAPNI